MIACQPRIMGVFEEIISSHGHARFAIRDLSTYMVRGMPLPQSLSFVQLMSLVRQSGDLAVGWSKPEEVEEDEQNKEAIIFHEKMAEVLKAAHPDSLCVGWEMNPPDKTEPRAWSETDRVVVLCTKASEE